MGGHSMKVALGVRRLEKQCEPLGTFRSGRPLRSSPESVNTPSFARPLQSGAGKPTSAEAVPETVRRKAIEEEVARLEARIADYEVALAQFVSIEETRRNTELVEKCRSELTALLSEWEDVTQQLEA
jgi:hypothetical protein